MRSVKSKAKKIKYLYQIHPCPQITILILSNDFTNQTNRSS